MKPQTFSEWNSNHPTNACTLWYLANMLGSCLGWEHPLHLEALEAWRKEEPWTNFGGKFKSEEAREFLEHIGERQREEVNVNSLPTNTMNPESITVDFKTAKKLMKAGYQPKNAVHYWWSIFPKDEEGPELTTELPDDLLESDHDGLMAVGIDPVTGKAWEHQYLAAPTAEEILRRLPEKFIHGEAFTLFTAITNRGNPHGNGWYVGYKCFAENTWYPEIDGQVSDTLANASAAMWCYLKENNLLPDV